MERFDIEASLRKINPKFVEEMTAEERERAIDSFKKVYALQMSKASDEISKRRKVEENLQQLKRQQQSELQSIEQGLNRKMSNVQKNRSRHKQSKTKELKSLQDNWKRRWQSIVKKRRVHQIQAFEKAQKARKETQQYFAKKHQFMQTTKSKKPNQDRVNQTEINYFKKSNVKSSFSKEQRSVSIDHYKISSFYRPEPLPTIGKKTSSKNGFQSVNFSLNCVDTPEGRGAEVKYNRERFERSKRQKQEQVFQRMINKLERIQKNRQSVQQRKEKFVLQAKKQRELRENPQKLARNRQRSLDMLNMRRRVKEQRQASIQRSSSKLRLDQSIVQHRQAKKLIEQSQFNQREQSYQAKFQRIKKSKMQRIVREAVHSLKQEALWQLRSRE